VTITVVLGYAIGALAGWSFSRSERIAPAWRVITRA